MSGGCCHVQGACVVAHKQHCSAAAPTGCATALSVLCQLMLYDYISKLGVLGLQLSGNLRTRCQHSHLSLEVHAHQGSAVNIERSSQNGIDQMIGKPAQIGCMDTSCFADRVIYTIP